MVRRSENRGLFKTKSWELTVRKLLRRRRRRNNDNKENKIVGSKVYAQFQGEDSSLHSVSQMIASGNEDDCCSSLAVETSFDLFDLDITGFPTADVCFENASDDDDDDEAASSDITLDSVFLDVVKKLTPPLQNNINKNSEALFRSPPMFGMQFGVASSDEEDDPPDSTAILGATPLYASQKVRRQSLIRFRK